MSRESTGALKTVRDPAFTRMFVSTGAVRC